MVISEELPTGAGARFPRKFEGLDVGGRGVLRGLVVGAPVFERLVTKKSEKSERNLEEKSNGVIYLFELYLVFERGAWEEL